VKPSSVHYALIILDGLGDLPNPETGGISPVEAAATPNLDRLVRQGANGNVVVIGPGVAPESDAGVLALLGYDPARESPGRGVLEALGVEVPLAPGDVALRLNFATGDGTDRVLDSRVGRGLGTEEARDLARSLTQADLLAPESIHAEVRATVGHRGVLWLHPTGEGALSPEISNSDPFYDKDGGLGQARVVEDPRVRVVVPLDGTPEAARTARAVNDLLARAAPILSAHRVNAKRAISGKKVANLLLVRNAGAIPSEGPPRFEEKYGLAGAAVTEMPVERGIARLLGLRDRYVGPMGPDRSRSLAERAQVTRAALREDPFVYVHLKGPDEPGHDGLAVKKKEIIEDLDRSFFGPFLDGLDWATHRILVTADHSTPCVLRSHSDDPVPMLLVGAGVPADGPPPTGTPDKFCERRAAVGSLRTRRGREVLPLLLGTSRTA
jgi:2,3-bisphosphoglycerate-independent phosphoglycerate mutase